MNTLKAEKRNAKAKALRREGYVTGNLFGREIEGSIPVKMTQKDVSDVLRYNDKGSQLFLEVEGKKYDVIIKEIDYDNMAKHVLDIEFQALDEGDTVLQVATREMYDLNEVYMSETPSASKTISISGSAASQQIITQTSSPDQPVAETELKGVDEKPDEGISGKTLFMVIIIAVPIVLIIIIAIILWWSSFISKVSEPFLVILNALPKVALGPVIIIWVGAGMPAIIVMALAISLIVTILNILNGLINTDKEKIKMAETFNASKFQILTKIVIPANISTLFNTLKVNIGLSLVGVISGEFLVSKGGLGYLIVYGGQVFKLDLVMTSVIILAIVAAVMYESIEILEKIVMKQR